MPRGSHVSTQHPIFSTLVRSSRPAYSSDYPGDGPHYLVYSPPPRNINPYRIIRIIYREPGSMSLMRGEYRHPKYVFGCWLKLFLHIAFYTVVRRKITRERKLICRTWKHLLETASAASLKTAITPARCSTAPSLPSRLLTGLSQPYGISITPICVFPPDKQVILHLPGCNRVVECAIQHRQRHRCSCPKSATTRPLCLDTPPQFSSRDCCA